jgi:GNAT superfamily N-acetyltransferase
MELRDVGYDHPDSLLLIEEVQQEYVIRYGGPDESLVDPSEFRPPNGRFTVGYLEGRPVACGGWRIRSGVEDAELLDGDAELKRLFVRSAARGRGLARLILSRLEEQAREAGRLRMVLETGREQPEAIGLYTSVGYLPMGGFGHYRDEEGSRYFAKGLAVRGLNSLPKSRSSVETALTLGGDLG